MSDAFGAELKTQRKKAGLTQADAATQLGVSRPTLTQWEASRHRPTPEHIARLDEIYGARGVLIELGQRGEDSIEEQPPQARRTLDEVFLRVGKALEAKMIRDSDGRPLGWSHNLLDGSPTPLSTAFVLRTLQLLDDARVDLHALGEALEQRRQPDGWSNRPGRPARPEVTAVVLAALARLGRLSDVDADIAMLERGVDSYAERRSFVLAQVLDSLLAIRPDAPLVTRLSELLLQSRIKFKKSLLWTVDASASPGIVEPSLAHTARSTAVLRAAARVAANNELDDAVDMAIEWMISNGVSDDGITEILRPDPKDGSAIVPVNHFTSAWTIRAMVGVERVPVPRLMTSLNALWACYVPEEGLWAWRSDGSLPSWMSLDAVTALRLVALQSMSTPVTISP